MAIKPKEEAMSFASQNLTAGQLNAIVKKLGGEDGAMRFLRGDAEVVIKTHTIDCDSDPHSPRISSSRD